MALQQMIDKKNTILSSFYSGQILSALPEKIIRSGANFVKSCQTICICKALLMPAGCEELSRELEPIRSILSKLTDE